MCVCVCVCVCMGGGVQLLCISVLFQLTNMSPSEIFYIVDKFLNKMVGARAE